MIGTMLGPYRVLEKLGEGGMGEVYKARDTRLDRTVAIKVLPPAVAADPERRGRFEREAKTIAALNHPHICTLYDVGDHDGSMFLVMEHVVGETLAARLRRGPLPVEQALVIATDIADGLAAAHRSGIIHRDLKPGNVMLTKSGAKLLDFGLAKLKAPGAALVTSVTMSALPTQEPPTAAGTLLGTVPYMAPEQLEGKEADARSDIFSFGAVLYEMLAGKRAFDGQSQVSVMAAILEHDPPPLSSMQPVTPAALDHLVRRCLAKAPDDRPDTAHDVADDLRWLRESMLAPGAAAGGGLPPRKHGRLMLAAVATGLLACVVVAFLVGHRRGIAAGVEAAPKLPTYIPLTFREGTVLDARFAPDGRTVVYTALWEHDPPRVFQGGSPFDEPTPLGFDDARILAVSSTNQMAILQHPRDVYPFGGAGTLARASAGGGARPLAEDVSWADWSSDGRLCVVRKVGGSSRLEIDGSVLYEVALPGWISHPRFSPHGDLIAFNDHPIGGDEGSIAVVDMGRKKKSLTGVFQSVRGVAWNPAGDEIFFGAVVPRGEIYADEISAVRLSGQTRTVVRGIQALTVWDMARDGRLLTTAVVLTKGMRGTSGSGPERELTWDANMAADLSEDGRTLLFTTPGYGVFVRGMDGSPAVVLDAQDYPLALSPDGRSVASVSFHDNAIARGGPFKLQIVPVGPGTTRTLPRGPLERYFAGFGSSWSPDGQALLFFAREPGGSPRLYIQRFDGSLPRAVGFDGVRLADKHAVTPDGKAFLGADQDGRLAVYPLDGGSPRPINGMASDVDPIRWTTDGRGLIASDRPPLHVYRIDVVTGRRQVLHEIHPPERPGLFSLGGVIASADGRGYVYSYSQLRSQLVVIEGLK